MDKCWAQITIPMNQPLPPEMQEKLEWLKKVKATEGKEEEESNPISPHDTVSENATVSEPNANGCYNPSCTSVGTVSLVSIYPLQFAYKDRKRVPGA
jgi:hypothetical protein